MVDRKVALIGLCVGTAFALWPAGATAQIDPGVNYDPGSPAGKEYAIPLVEGRSEGAGTTDQQEGANIPFGVGITPRSRRADRNERGARRNDAPAIQGARPGESSDELAARIAAAEEPAGTAARTLLLALAVLLPAGLLALLLRQRPQLSRTGRAA